MEQALQIEGILRFVGLFALMVLVPAILLAWYGLGSIRVEELGLDQEVSLDAADRSERVISNLQDDVLSFEQRVLERIESGHSPLVGLVQLEQSLALVVELDSSFEMRSPFVLSEPLMIQDSSPVFDSRWQEAWRLEQEQADADAVAEAYRAVANDTRSTALRGLALLHQGRMLGEANQTDAAVQILEQVIVDYGNVRDSMGFVLGDLASLEVGELLRETSPDSSFGTLEDLVSTLIQRRWVLNNGADAAVARRALSIMETDPDRTPKDSDLLVVYERSQMQYWASQLLPEFQDRINEENQFVVSDSFHWFSTENAIWGLIRWQDGVYAFALKKQEVMERIQGFIGQYVTTQDLLTAEVLPTVGVEQTDALSVRNLGPWLPSLSLVVTARDPVALVDTGTQRAQRRLWIVLVTLGLIVVGILLSARQIKRELDIARMQTDFAANVSHELRSPITQIRLKGEMLMLGMCDEEQERQEAYQAIVRESERLSRLVDNVLDFGAIERGLKQYDMRPADLAATVHRAVDIVSSSQEVQDKTLDLALSEVLPAVEHDPDAIAQCVINLVSNAAKYSDSNGWIGIRCRVLQRAVEITVSDKGIGIAPQDLKNIFEPFFRSEDKSARLRKGTGIGLTITRYIMEAHGGQVSVQSRPGVGSTFTLRFPCSPGDENPRYS